MRLRWNGLKIGTILCGLVAVCSPDSLRGQSLIAGSSLIQLNGQVNGGAVTQNLNLSSAPNPNTTYTASVTNCTGGNWLTVTPSSGITPQTLALTATPGALAANTYSCALNLTATNSSVGVAVIFSVTGGGAGSFTSNPASITFSHQLGQTPPASAFTISTTAASVLFTATATSSPTNWLLVNNTGSTTGTTGTAQATITASVNPSGLVAGTYSGTIQVSGSGQATLNIPVTLTVNALPTLIAAPTSLTFNYQLNTQPLPPAQVISLTSSGSALTNVIASTSTSSCGSGWLVASPLSGQLTPASLNVFVAIPASSPAVCTGTITISTPGAQNPTVQIPVTLNLSNNPVLNVTPAALTLTYQTGATAPSGTVAVSSSGTPLSFSAVASVSTPAGGNWLNVTPAGATTPAVLNIGTTPQSLAAGTYNGVISINSPGAANPAQTIAVTLTVTNNPTLVFTPTQLNFAYQINGLQPASQVVNVGSSSGSLIIYTIATTTVTGGGWLNVISGQSGVTPGAITVAANPVGLAAGRYDGSVNVTATGAGVPAQTIPVTLYVSPTALLLASPPSLTYNFPAGSTGVDTSRSISVTSTDGSVISYGATGSTSIGAGWLLLGQGAGSTPSNVSVGVNPTGLTAGRYAGLVTITALTAGVANSPQTIPIVVNITGSSTGIQVSPASLGFAQVTGQAAPATQTLAISSGSGALPFNITTNTVTGGNWLGATPVSGTTNNTLVVSVNGALLPAGTYNGSIVISSAGVASVTVPVQLQVTGTSQLLNPPFYVAQLYRDFFGREADAAGLNYWVGQVNALGRAQIGYGFFISPEFQDGGFFVVSAYKSVFGRDADFGGWQFYTTNTRRLTQQQIIDEFLLSAEFVQVYGSLNNTAFVNLVYQNVLGRAPDPGGLAFYLGLLNSGQITRGQMMWQFTVGVEFHARVQNRALATLMYIGFLRRSPEPAGADFWTGELNRGVSPVTVVGNFVNSVEYLARY